MAAVDSIAVGNVMDVWGDATVDELTEGLGWYEAARTFAVGLSERYGVSLEVAAGVLAALSPKVNWDRNMWAGDYLLRTGRKPPQVLPYSVERARRIMAGEDIDTVLMCARCARGDKRSHTCSGEKVRQFYACLTDPACDAVCVDRHAFDIAAGRMTNDRVRKALDRKGVYGVVADTYRVTAALVSLQVGITVAASAVQAVTWVVWRNRKGL
jgi:hypothetical protein